MNRINVGFVITYLNKGGPSKVLINLIKNMDRKKYNIFLFTLLNKNNKEKIDELKNQNVKVIELNNSNYFEVIWNCKTQFKKLIKEYSIEVLNSHGILSDIISANLKVKNIATIHNNMIEDYINKHGKSIGSIMIKLHLHYLKKFNRVIGCSKNVADNLSKKLDNVDYIRNGTENIDTEPNELRSQYSIKLNDKVFVYTGHISQEKRVLELVKAFTKYHLEDEFLIIVGDGEELSACKKNADRHIIFTGWQDNPNKYLVNGDIYISASKSEGFSMAVLDALNFGMAMFLSDIPSHREIYDIYSNVYIGEYFTFENFKLKLAELRKNYNKINKQQIITTKKDRLSSESMTKKYEQLINRLCNER